MCTVVRLRAGCITMGGDAGEGATETWVMDFLSVAFPSLLLCITSLYSFPLIVI